ncbi:MAG: DUF4112 domain-containing protein [Proteobacteria bacterium]|nr:MAG: DUF4112 domain-containing protein [Pseudomonadota bacterium]
MTTNHKHLDIIRRLSHFLDNAIPIPGTKYRVGLDPIIGLIPGIGDAVTSLMSTYIILIAMQMGVSRWTLTRMVFNVLIESIVGIVPVVGDLFDAAWKSNEKNRILLEASLLNPRGPAADRVFVVGMVFVLLLIFVATGVGAFMLLKWIFQQF